MYVPNSKQILAEVYECSGQVQFQAKGKYTDLQAKTSEHIKRNGHLIVKIEKNQEHVSFARLDYKQSKKGVVPVFIFRYSHFNPLIDPYEQIRFEESRIGYEVADDKLRFDLPKVTVSDVYKVVSLTYKIVVAASMQQVTSAVQCDHNTEAMVMAKDGQSIE